MDQTLPPRLPANLECAVQRVRMAVRSAAEHTVDSLGLAALASNNVLQRDALLGAQYELNRKLAIFALTFNEALDLDVARQAGTLVATPNPSLTPDSLVASWESLTLVDDHEVEIHISADRFALEIGHACEWEIRELDAYMATLLHLGGADHERNPLRAEVLGQAMIRAIEAVSERPEVRKVLGNEISRSLARAMRQTYGDIVADLRHAGVRPMGMAVRNTPTRSMSVHGGLQSGYAQMDSQHGGHGLSSPAPLSSQHGRSGFAPSTRGALAATMGQVDGEMMSLIRHLALRSPGTVRDDDSGQGAAQGHANLVRHGGMASMTDVVGGQDNAWGMGGHGAAGQALVASNLIHTHRNELHQAAGNSLDHMVIDVVAGLFDQILSDAKVPPQMARQIARLQLPVLRAALGDNSFFSSRRHPVRRFINRIASLGTAVDDFDGDQGRALLARVAALVQEVVDGEFDQIAVYERQLAALEAFIADQARTEVRALGAADVVLAQKEDLLRVQQRYAQELEDALRDLRVPDYMRGFLADTWSQVIASVAIDEGGDGAQTSSLRHVGRELVMSVQPKGSPHLRQQFFRQLPQLMKDLNHGLDRIRCPDNVRQAFFGKLLPAHAESLKGQALSTLEQNLLARQVDGALATRVPRAADLPAMGPTSSQAMRALQDQASAAAFSPAEAHAVGLIDEAAVDWSKAVDIDLGAEAPLTSADITFDGLPAPDAVEPMQGKSLADHVQIGFAYLMQLKGDWQKVRLAHISPGRSFFVFSHGAKQRETVSMTHRMLVKLCEAGRLRAMESAYLLERATARARRQLKELAPARSAADTDHGRSEADRFAKQPDLRRQVSPSGLTPQGGNASSPAEPAPRRSLGDFFSRRR